MNAYSGCWTVSPTDARTRLDQFLGRIFPEQSRSQIQAWIRAGQALVCGTRVKTGYLVKPGDEITVAVAPKPSDLPAPENIPLEIVYEDADMVVVNKPAGLVCHSGAGVRTGTLVNALLYHFGPFDAGDPKRPGIVHRLDRFTSGLLVVAKNSVSHRALSQQFKKRAVTKEYLALVYGCPEPPAGTIDSALGRDPGDRKKMSVRARHARTAITHYRVEQRFGPFCLLNVRIETGRTHQIRVHLAHAGHPVVGDLTYGGNRARNLSPALRDAVQGLGRTFLHAYRLELRHPRSGSALSWSAPLSPELQQFLQSVASTYSL